MYSSIVNRGETRQTLKGWPFVSYVRFNCIITWHWQCAHQGEFLNNMADTNDLFLPQEMQKPSSETQGQLVGSIKCPWWKFTVRSRRAPGHLLLPNQFQKRLNCPLLIGQKNFFWPISEEEQPGDCDVFLDAVVAVEENLIDRHSCVARSTGKVSRGKFQN